MSTANSNNSTNHHHGDRDLSLWFLEQSRLASARGLTDEDKDSPTKLNTINSSDGFIIVSPDKLSAKYTSVNLHSHDVGVVQANKPASVKRLVYYFEIYDKDAGTKGQISIGFKGSFGLFNI